MPPGYRTPAQLIEAKLAELGWNQRVLALVVNLHPTVISKILGGKKPIDAELALVFQMALGINAEELLQLQKSYELARAQLEVVIDPSLSTRAALFGGLPVAEMVKRGWFPGITDVRDGNLEGALCRFFGADSLDQIEVLPHAAKKTNVFAEATPSQIAWLYRVQQIAVDILVPKYSPGAGVDAVRSLKPLLVSPHAARKVPRILAERGIRFCIVEALPGSKIDGVCFWLDGRSPVVALSMRFDRIDNFWFVLRHELEHVLCKHGGSCAMLDADLEKDRAGTGDNVPEEERVANQAAAEFCVPQASLQKFINRKTPFFYERDVLGFAKTLDIHPGLVVGQLQHRTGRYDLHRNHLVKIRSVVAPNAMVDGWGDVAPVEI